MKFCTKVQTTGAIKSLGTVPSSFTPFIARCYRVFHAVFQHLLHLPQHTVRLADPAPLAALPQHEDRDGAEEDDDGRPHGRDRVERRQRRGGEAREIQNRRIGRQVLRAVLRVIIRLMEAGFVTDLVDLPWF